MTDFEGDFQYLPEHFTYAENEPEDEHSLYKCPTGDLLSPDGSVLQGGVNVDELLVGQTVRVLGERLKTVSLRHKPALDRGTLLTDDITQAFVFTYLLRRPLLDQRGKARSFESGDSLGMFLNLGQKNGEVQSKVTSFLKDYRHSEEVHYHRYNLTQCLRSA